jgi:hypothetical protein
MEGIVMSIEAMKLALEALEAHADLGIKSDKAITALRTAIAEAEKQEPVAKYIGECKDGSLVQLYADVKKGTDFYTTPPAQPEQPAPVQEPVAEVVWGAKTDFEWKFKMLVELACVKDVPVKLYAGPFKGAAMYWHDTETDKRTTPPAAQRQPLTDEEIRKFADTHLFYQPEGYEVSGIFNLARAIEAAHGIKEST